MDKKRYRIEYNIQGVTSIMPFYIIVEAKSIDDLDSISNDDIKDRIMLEDKLAMARGKDAITLFR